MAREDPRRTEEKSVSSRENEHFPRLLVEPLVRRQLRKSCRDTSRIARPVCSIQRRVARKTIFRSDAKKNF